MRKLNRPTDERKALLRGLATDLLWYGRIETTLEKAKEVRTYVEKLLTRAINTYEDTVKVTKTVTDEKGAKVSKEFVNDGPKKLTARRYIMSKTYDIAEQRQPKEAKAAFVARTKDIKHPLIEKIFNEYAPAFAKRNADKNCAGGYTRIMKLGVRLGDNAEMAIVEIIL
ncbi:MAG: 50S ribosomal protein L17 [Clostridia bacterium]|nr:50S ribosomal protein L17 [Clostridia bacterium]